MPFDALGMIETKGLVGAEAQPVQTGRDVARWRRRARSRGTPSEPWSKRFVRILTDDGAGRFRSSSSAVARQPAVTYKTERTEVERAQRRGEGGERRGPAPLSIRPFTA
jgi:hypothetical protein